MEDCAARSRPRAVRRDACCDAHHRSAQLGPVILGRKGVLMNVRSGHARWVAAMTVAIASGMLRPARTVPS
jgi:hypothetical protein